MRRLVPQPADHHALAEIPRLGADAERAARHREAAIGGDQQARPQAAAILQGQLHPLDIGAQAGHAGAGQQRHLLRGGGGAVEGAADGVVGDQLAQLGLGAAAGVEAQRIGRAAIQHPRLAQRRDALLRDQRPRPHRAQQRLGMVGERDLPPVEAGLLQRRLRLLLDHRDGEPGAGEGGGQRQPGRTAAHDRDIELHLRCLLRPGR
ncbi:hypothetical protein QE401_004107 [Pseudoroseomonas cervicalis]|nr:hypothetical protein [Pseudoroseomonas cervicalis]